jgi:uncharacterized membrane-anchored protein YitT (DUF2179 family)
MSASRPPFAPVPAANHRPYEDVLALFMGTLLAALGLVFYQEATLTAGSVAGIALLVQYATGVPFGISFALLNLPFFALAILQMGWSFTLRTVAAILLLSGLSALMPRLIDISSMDPLFAAIAGGALTGMGILILIRHRAGLGGFNILSVFLQERYGIRAGYFQLAVDLVILGFAALVIPFEGIVLSVVAAVVLNLTLAINHRPGRYMG